MKFRLIFKVGPEIN